MVKANINGTKIAYEELGNGAPLVLIHGYPLDHTIWDEIAPLLDHEFHLILPDLRGFGQSDIKEADNSISGYASDIQGLLKHLKIKKAFLAGHSMGGYVALAFARKYPDEVSGLALISSQAAADSSERKQGRYATGKQVLAEGVNTVVESMTPKLSADKRIQSYVRELISRQKPQGISNALAAMAERPDSADLLPTLRFPLIIVHGDADELIPIERGREMKAALPNAHYMELPSTGHMPMMENPHAVAEALHFLIK